ncbi:MAG: hypothetical protein ACK4KX_03230 [Parvibaculum sp.]
MPEIELVREFLAAGADGALIAVALALWKLDRRVVRIETIMERVVGE